MSIACIAGIQVKNICAANNNYNNYYYYNNIIIADCNSILHVNHYCGIWLSLCNIAGLI